MRGDMGRNVLCFATQLPPHATRGGNYPWRLFRLRQHCHTNTTNCTLGINVPKRSAQERGAQGRGALHHRINERSAPQRCATAFTAAAQRVLL
jgi:hypothetical protein